MSLATKVGLALVCLAAAFAAGRWTLPAKVETRVEYVERLQVVKQVVVERVVDTKTRTVRVIETRPDGSSRTEERIDSETRTDERIAENTKADKTTETKSVKSTTAHTNFWQVHLVGHLAISNAQDGSLKILPGFGVAVSRRLLGPLWGSISADSSKRVGVGIGLEF